MSKLDTTTILQNAEAGIGNWNFIRNNSTQTVPLFSPNYYFSFPKSSVDTWQSYLSGLPEDEQQLHVYLSVDSMTSPTQLSAYMVDSATDRLNPSSSSSQTQYNSSLHFSDYQQYNFSNTYNNAAVGDGNIDPTEAETRIQRWNDNYTAWLEYQAGQGMTQVFAVPFSDLEALFGAADSSSANYGVFFFALAPYPLPGTASSAELAAEEKKKRTTMEETFEPQNYYLEFILYQAVDDGKSGQLLDKNAPEDIICPAPPFNNYTGPASTYQLLP